MCCLFTRDKDILFESEGLDVNKLSQKTEAHATIQAEARSYNIAINKISRKAHAAGEEPEQERASENFPSDVPETENIAK